MSGKNVLSVRLTLLQSLLSAADIPYVIFDQHISALEPVSPSVFTPRHGQEGYLFSARARLDGKAL